MRDEPGHGTIEQHTGLIRCRPGSRNHTKVLTRHVWESKEAIDRHRLERVGKRLYKRRKETVERSFADAKQLHGHRYARMRGLSKAQQQCLLAATAQNINKIALPLSRNTADLPAHLTCVLLQPYLGMLQRFQKLPSNPTLFRSIQPQKKPHQNDGIRQQSEEQP